MGQDSKIQWTHHTFNPWRGCTKVSDGCKHCYADTQSKRSPSVLGVWGPNGTRVVAAESAWKEPLKWDRAAAKAGERHRVFCASLADVFEDWQGHLSDARGFSLVHHSVLGWTSFHGSREHADETDTLVTMQDVRKRLFDLIDSTPNLDWLLLTKRPENIGRMIPDYRVHTPEMSVTYRGFSGARPNVWLGTSVENQATADERIPHLLRIPAAVRFLSCEPLLGPGPVDLRRAVPRGEQAGACRVCGWGDTLRIPNRTSVDGRLYCPDCRLGAIDWVIVGGESGPNARPCRVEWVRGIVRQCKDAGVPCFVKQLGSVPAVFESLDAGGWPEHVEFHKRDTGPTDLLKLSDPKGSDLSEWPADLRVREFPTIRSQS